MLYDLDAGSDPAVLGAKAARLAQARAAGLPALPGVVIPVTVAAPALRHGAQVLRARGSGAARLAVSQTGLDTALVAALEAAGRRLGPPLVARSSSAVEAGTEWAGAFTSYLGLAPSELAVGVRGCWASVFAPDALSRCEAEGLDPGALALAVLVQPELQPQAGGSARVQADGTVELRAVLGSPAPLLAGWEPGAAARVPGHGAPEGAAVALLGARAVLEVASLARAVHGLADDDLIEWALADGRVVLLQSQISGWAASAPTTSPVLAGPDLARWLGAARVVTRYRGPLADELVLPWAIACDPLPEPARIAVVSPAEAVAEARVLARRLDGHAPVALLRALDHGVNDLQPARTAPTAEGARLLGLLLGVGRRLAERGLLRTAEDVWSYPAERIAADTLAPRFQAPADGWDPFLIAAARGHGRAVGGTAAAPGVGAGAARSVAETIAAPVLRPREVLIADRPVPALAPLLWNASGLVTRGGGPGAHLVEVARSLGVPAVTGCPLEVPDGTLLAVDGDRGVVHAS